MDRRSPLDENGNSLRYYKCESDSHTQGRCPPGVIRAHVSDRMRSGVAAVNIVSDLVLGFEGETQQPAVYETSLEEDSTVKKKLTPVGSPSHQLHEFDYLTDSMR